MIPPVETSVQTVQTGQRRWRRWRRLVVLAATVCLLGCIPVAWQYYSVNRHILVEEILLATKDTEVFLHCPDDDLANLCLCFDSGIMVPNKVQEHYRIDNEPLWTKNYNVTMHERWSPNGSPPEETFEFGRCAILTRQNVHPDNWQIGDQMNQYASTLALALRQGRPGWISHTLRTNLDTIFDGLVLPPFPLDLVDEVQFHRVNYDGETYNSTSINEIKAGPTLVTFKKNFHRQFWDVQKVRDVITQHFHLQPKLVDDVRRLFKSFGRNRKFVGVYVEYDKNKQIDSKQVQFVQNKMLEYQKQKNENHKIHFMIVSNEIAQVSTEFKDFANSATFISIVDSTALSFGVLTQSSEIIDTNTITGELAAYVSNITRVSPTL